MRRYFFVIFFDTIHKAPPSALCVLWHRLYDWRVPGLTDKSGEESPFFDHRYGTPKGQAEGPEKPAAWHYYFQRGAAREQHVSKCRVSSSLLSSSSSPKHSDSHRQHSHTKASPFALYSFILCFVSVSSVCTCRAVTCRDCQSWTMPPSVIWGRGLSCSASRLEAEDKEERVRGKSPELITVTVCCGSEKTLVTWYECVCVCVCACEREKERRGSPRQHGGTAGESQVKGNSWHSRELSDLEFLCYWTSGTGQIYHWARQI